MASSPSTNPYDLGARKGGPARPVQSAPYTEAEQLEKLVGYVVVPKEYWPNVKYATHVRYTETAAKGGLFRSGGFVLQNPYDTKVHGGATEKRFFRLQNSFNPKTRQEWIAAYEDIEYLYVKGTGVELTLQNDLHGAVKTLNANVHRLAAIIKKLEQRLELLEGRRGE